MRDRARRRQMRLVQNAWQYFALWLSLGALAIIGTAFVVHGNFLRGIVVGAGSVFVVGSAVATVVMFSGTANVVMGSVAEQWTASELRPLRRHGWFLANHIMFGFGDIDHVLIGPGGLIVAETKWAGEGWELDPPSTRVSRAIRQVKTSADRLALWKESNLLGRRVPSALFLWSAADRGTQEPDYTVIDGVAVITSVGQAEKWRGRVLQLASVLNDADACRLRDALLAQSKSREKHETRAQPVTPSYTHIYWQVMATLTAALAAVYACAAAATARMWVWLPVDLAALAHGWLARRWPVTRYPALGWITGSTVVLAASVTIAIGSI